MGKVVANMILKDFAFSAFKRYREKMNSSRTMLRRFFAAHICMVAVIATMSQAATPMLAAGQQDSLFLKSDGSVWGSGYVTNHYPGATSPVRLLQLPNVVAISTFDGTNFALLSDGTVWGSGQNDRGQLADGTTINRAQPQQIPGLSGIIAVKASVHILALKQDGSVWAWGSNSHGQLGDGTKTDRTIPTRVVGLTNVIKISANFEGSSAISSDGTVWVWGFTCCGAAGNGQDQSPPGDVTNSTLVPTKVSNFDQVIAISAIGNRHMALRSDGTVWSWGAGYLGEHGTGVPGNQLVPIRVPGLDQVIAIDASGSGFSLALKSDGTVWAWGSNSFGRLGVGGLTSIASPIQVPGLSNVVSICAGWYHVLAMRSDGLVFAWGWNGNGQLGDGTFLDHSNPRMLLAPGGSGQFNLLSATPANVNQLPSAQISLNTNSGTAPLTVQATAINASDPDGTVTGYLWKSSTGQQQNGTSATFTFNAPGTYDIDLLVEDNVGGRGSVRQQVLVTPAAIAVLARPKVAVGLASSVALANDGRILTWGFFPYLGFYDSQAQGLLPQTNSAPMSNGITGAVDIALGSNTTHVVMADGTVLGWGGNASGEVGSGNQAFNVYQPQQLPNLPPIQSVSNGWFHSLALTRDGRIFSWGGNARGQLGLGDSSNRYQPVEVTGISNVIAVAAGFEHSLALRADGTVWAWGVNSNYELGDGTQISRNRPIQILGLSGITKIFSATSGASFFLKSDGTVWVTAYLPSPIPGDPGPAAGPRHISAYDGITQIAGRYDRVVALKADGTVWTGGQKSSQALGFAVSGDIAGLQQVPGISNAISLASGANSVMVLLRDGTLLSWGINIYGELGDGTLARRPTPVSVINETLTGLLDLWPSVPKDKPFNAPPFFSKASSNSATTASVLTVNNLTKFKPADVGNTGSVYVFALAPASLVQNAPLSALSRQAGSATAAATTTSTTCVLAQLDASGQLVATSANLLQAYLTGVLTSQGASVNVLNGVSTALLQGATFFVGYGTSPTSMFNNGTNLSMLTLGDFQACTTPDAFSFVPQTNVAMNTSATSNTVVIGGTSFVAAPISITNGSYRINSGTFVQSVGIVSRNDNVTMQVLSSAAPNTQTCATLDISGVAGPFCVTTMQAGATSFTLSINKSGLGTGIVTSNLGGISCGVDCSRDFASGTSVVLTATPALGSTFAGWNGACTGTGICTVTMDGAKSVTVAYALIPGTTSPDPFGFAIQTGAGLSQTITSNTITISGLTAIAPISIVNGSYRINMGSYTSSAGTINSGDSVTVQVASSPNYNTPVCATLNISGVNGTFCVTTTAQPYPVVSLNMTNLDFTPRFVGMNSAVQTITLTNAGNAPLYFTSIVASGDFAIANYCGAGVVAGGSCGIAVTFIPMAIGTRTGAITITSDAAGSPHSVILTGTGVSVSAPDAPTNVFATPGITQASITFFPPANVGGAAISGYTATCNPGAVSASGYFPPIIVKALTNDVNYTCFVTASNVAGTSVASATASVMPSASVPFALLGVRSRKIHGNAGAFELPIDTSQSIGGLVTVEPRFIGSGHSVVFQFNGTVSSVGSVNALPIGSATATYSGNEVQVTVTDVPDNKRISINLGNVNGSASSPPVSLGFLVGDVNNSRVVNSGDISGVKAHAGQTTNGANFKFDVNASGSINSQDISAVKARAGLRLP